MEKKHYNARDWAGHFHGNAILTLYSGNFEKIFEHLIIFIKAELLAKYEFSNFNFQAGYSQFFYVGDAGESAQILDLFLNFFFQFWISKWVL